MAAKAQRNRRPPSPSSRGASWCQCQWSRKNPVFRFRVSHASFRETTTLKCFFVFVFVFVFDCCSRTNDTQSVCLCLHLGNCACNLTFARLEKRENPTLPTVVFFCFCFSFTQVDEKTKNTKKKYNLYDGKQKY